MAFLARFTIHRNNQCHISMKALSLVQKVRCTSSMKDIPPKVPLKFIDAVSAKYNLNLNEKEMEEYQSLIPCDTMTETVDTLFTKYKDTIYPEIPMRSMRTYQKPKAGSAENKFGQWIVTTNIPPTNPDGPLKGKTFGIKDNISVAGIPCQNGSEMFEDFIPSIDATVVTRILEAGAVSI